MNEQCNRNDDGIVITIDESLKKREIEHLDALIRVKEEQLNELKKKLGSLCIDAKGPDVTPASLLSILVNRYSIATLHLQDNAITAMPYKRKIQKKRATLNVDENGDMAGS